MNNENQNIKCVSCKKIKSTTDFTINIKTNFLYKSCIQCIQRKKDYYIDNLEKVRKRHKEYYIENSEKILKQTNEYKNVNKEKIIKQKKEYLMDIKNRIRKSVNRRISDVIKNKLPDYKFYLGIDIIEYITYLESKFKEGMNLENYGTVWNIDHVLPLKPKVKISEDEVIKRLKYTNTQPLYCIENMIKYNKETIQEELCKNFENKEEQEEKEYAEITFVDEDEVLQVIIDTYL